MSNFPEFPLAPTTEIRPTTPQPRPGNRLTRLISGSKK